MWYVTWTDELGPLVERKRSEAEAKLRASDLRQRGRVVLVTDDPSQVPETRQYDWTINAYVEA